MKISRKCIQLRVLAFAFKYILCFPFMSVDEENFQLYGFPFPKSNILCFNFVPNF